MTDELNEATPIQEDDPPRPIPSTPVSLRTIATNRSSSRRPTGRREAAAKRGRRLNPLKHGLTARDTIIPALDGPHAEREFNRLRTALRRYYDSADPLVAFDVDELASLQWWKRRALRSLRSVVLKRLARTHAEASQAQRDVPVLAMADKGALATSPEAVQSLLGILEEIRREVEPLGGLSEPARAKLVANFPVVPGGFVELCFIYSALAALDAEPMTQPERPGGLPSAAHCKEVIIAVLQHEQDRLRGLKKTLEGHEAQQREVDALVTLRPETDDETILDYYARFQRQSDRIRDRLDRQRRQRRGEPLPPTLNLNVHGAA
jgi:hypothetical protein